MPEEPLIAITRDDLGPILDRASAVLTQRRMNGAVRGEVLQLTQSHLIALDAARPNKLGGKRTHYYANAANGTTAQIEGEGVRISIHQIGMRQHFYGGTIVPGPGKKYLTIPARAEAHGRRATTFSSLIPLWSHKRKAFYALAYAEDEFVEVKSGKNKGKLRPQPRDKSATHGEGGILYWLVKSVTQVADESVIPAMAAYVGAARLALTRTLALALRREAATDQLT